MDDLQQGKSEGFESCDRPIQALTTPEIFRLPIGKSAGKNQVAPIKIQVAPFCRVP